MIESPTISKQDEEIILIKPSKGWGSLNLRELWIYRELIYFLTWRDLKVRYKQTALGAGWAILQPVLSMIVFSIFFGGLLNVHDLHEGLTHLGIGFGEALYFV